MGRDKRSLRLWGSTGPTLLEFVAGVLAPLCSDLIVVLNDPAAWRGLPARLVPDEVPGCGALGGLISGLAAMQYDQAIVVAGDMPLLNRQLLTALRDTPFAGDACVPADSAGLQPLHALYRRSCLRHLRRARDSGRLGLGAALAGLQISRPDPGLLQVHDPHGYSWFNLNTPADERLVRNQGL
jgi:molybdopterin-guanine dinucleotide biosynthesis protein A